nr:Armadillo repeat-containing protein 4 [Polyrhizophydium stewartii]
MASVPDGWADQILAMCPSLARDDVLLDLAHTGSVESTLNRVFDGLFLVGTRRDPSLVAVASLLDRPVRLAAPGPHSDGDSLGPAKAAVSDPASDSDTSPAVISLDSSDSEHELEMIGHKTPVDPAPSALTTTYAPAAGSAACLSSGEDDATDGRPAKMARISSLAAKAAEKTARAAERAALSAAKAAAKESIRQEKAAEKQRLQEERNRAKEAALLERELSLASRAANKMRQKCDCTKEMTVIMSKDWEADAAGQESVSALKEAGASVEIAIDSAVERSMTWRRTVERIWDSEKSLWRPCPRTVIYERYALVRLSCLQLAQLCVGTRLVVHFDSISRVFPDCRIIYLVEELDAFYRSRQRNQQSHYTRQIRSALADGGVDSAAQGKRSRQHRLVAPVDDGLPSRDVVEEYLVRLQLLSRGRCLIVVTKLSEIASWVTSFTEQIAYAPELRYRSMAALNFRFGDGVKSGANPRDTWTKMLEQISGVSSLKAMAVCERFPTLGHLLPGIRPRFLSIAMGTISSKLQWEDVPAAAAAAKEDLPRLRTSYNNQDVLLELARVLEQLCASFPTEAKTEFRKPLVWTSTLAPAAFASHATSSHWVVAGKGHKTTVASTALRPDGQPQFFMEQTSTPAGETGVFSARASTFDCLNRVLMVADEHKLRELQHIVESGGLVSYHSNRDPCMNILGISGGDGRGLIEAFEMFVNEQDPKKREHYSRLYKLMLALNKFELQLTQSALQSLHKDIVLDVAKVSEELEMLRAFCGREDRYALAGINWESDYTFMNGVKSPPWRQVHGEICYLSVQCRDHEELIVTASKRGYFINKGYTADDKGNEQLNYEQVSEVYPTLVDLLKTVSPHFASHIDRQEYLYHRDAMHASSAEKQPIQGDDGDQGDRTDDMAAQNKDRRNEKEMAKRNAQSKKKAKNQAKTQHSVEPSLKWRALGLTAEDSKSPGKSRMKKGSAEKKNRGNSSKKRLYKSASFDEEDFEDSDSEVSSEEEQQEKRQDNCKQYYQIQKLVKYLRSGNQTATIIAICSLRDFDLANEFNQTAIRDVGGLETLVNLLDTDDPKCKIGALKILKEVSENVQIRSAIADLDGMQPLVELLRDSDEELKCLAAETIAHCAKNARNRRSVRRYGGIRKLVRLLKAKPGSPEERVAISGALALATCSKSSKNKEAIQAAGSIPLLANLLESQNEKLLIPVVGILQECASDAMLSTLPEHYRLAIRSSGMIKFLVENLSSKNEELQTHCASAIFKCAEEDETRVLVRQYNGLTPLVSLLDNVANKDLLVAATGAVWKCARNRECRAASYKSVLTFVSDPVENVAALNKLNTIKKLVGLMENQPEDVLVNVVGALAEGRQGIRESGGITPLVNLLTGTNQALLVNVTTAVGASALDGICRLG